MVPFVSTQLSNLELALALAKRGNLPGAEALVGQNFDRLFASGQFKEAAEAAAGSPKVTPLLLGSERQILTSDNTKAHRLFSNKQTNSTHSSNAI